MDIIGQNGNDGEHYEAPVIQTLLADVEALEKEEEQISKPKDEPVGNVNDLKSNPNSFQIVNKDGSREFLNEEPKIDIRGTRAYVRLNDGREGWMDRDNSDRIIYM